MINLGPDHPPTKELLRTASRIRSWWLQSVGGYRLESRHRTPHENAFGQIYYKTEFVLTKDGAEDPK